MFAKIFEVLGYVCASRRRLVEGFRRGWRRGRARGHAAGLLAGTRQGEEKAWQEARLAYQQDMERNRRTGEWRAFVQAARALGLEANEAAVAKEFTQLDLRPRPNIFIPPFAHSVVYRSDYQEQMRIRRPCNIYVRLVVNDARQIKVYNVPEWVVEEGVDQPLAKALVQAVQWRNRWDPHNDVRGTVMREVLADRREEAWPTISELLGVCQDYHDRMMAYEHDGADIFYYGQDPSARFGEQAQREARRPWPTLFNNRKPPQRFVDAFSRLGLGTPSKPRAIRDLLLLTGTELVAVHNFGATSLNALRQKLQQRGLALWGEELRFNPGEADRGNRNYRSIDLNTEQS